MKHGKKYQESVKAFDLTKQYEANEAISVLLETAKAKFDETIEMHVRLGVDPRQADHLSVATTSTITALSLLQRRSLRKLPARAGSRTFRRECLTRLE